MTFNEDEMMNESRNPDNNTKSIVKTDRVQFQVETYTLEEAESDIEEDLNVLIKNLNYQKVIEILISW